jgi:hypothetical protein
MLLPRWGEVMLRASMPRAVPTADGVCPFRALVGAKCEEWECVKLWLGVLKLLIIGASRKTLYIFNSFY